MKKRIYLLSCILVIASILISFILVIYRDTRSYQQLAEEQLENIVTLANNDVTKQIESSMAKPITISKTMSNDTLLKEWIAGEKDHEGQEIYQERLIKYLKEYQRKYDYTTVFFVSDQTGIYYTQDGINKVISQQDEHDVWYYNFVQSGVESDMEIDTNETDDEHITIFVNCRVEDNDGNLLGVIGIGRQAKSIEQMIHAYEEKYDMSVFIVNEGGAQNSFTGDTDIFIQETDVEDKVGVSLSINKNRPDVSFMDWYTLGSERKCIATQYNSTLKWYMIFEKDTSSLTRVFTEKVVSNIAFMLIALVACITLVLIIIHVFNKKMIEIENTDELTGLPNRKLFEREFPKELRKLDGNAVIIMFDIDRFKNFNDQKGHLFGNAVLQNVGKKASELVQGDGLIARWGGDEFIGILRVDSKEAYDRMTKFMENLETCLETECISITISVGMQKIEGDHSFDEYVQMVDYLLYHSKKNGKNRITTQDDVIKN